jgi:P-type E1-E2 ATPase
MVKTVTKVIRDGSLQEIASSQVVPGDLIFIEEGDSITIDGRLIRSSNLAANESALTGESDPIEKEVETIDETELSRYCTCTSELPYELAVSSEDRNAGTPRKGFFGRAVF